MRRLILPFLAVAMFLCASCAVYAEYGVEGAEGNPGYVYTYPNGCWADGEWYGPCPWRLGATYGYYSFYGGYYYYVPGYRWGYRPGYPPPGAWRRWVPPAGPHYRVPPPGRFPGRPHYAPPREPREPRMPGGPPRHPGGPHHW